MSIHNITFRTIVQATESEDRVKNALSLFIFDEEINAIASEGHFGNPITILQARIEGKNCSRFIGLLKSSLPENELARLKNERCERIDEECIFHIRFDKQAAYKGEVQLASTTDTIAGQLKIKAFPAKKEKAITVSETIF